mmetsp:Transcript_36873/g.82014  ORF Transcript_36873/g.82014 Transcript_36873/m.82014 type:complete len:90 (+) Transcript_36873:388-657(+)
MHGHSDGLWKLKEKRTWKPVWQELCTHSQPAEAAAVNTSAAPVLPGQGTMQQALVDMSSEDAKEKKVQLVNCFHLLSRGQWLTGMSGKQ